MVRIYHVHEQALQRETLNRIILEDMGILIRHVSKEIGFHVGNSIDTTIIRNHVHYRKIDATCVPNLVIFKHEGGKPYE